MRRILLAAGLAVSMAAPVVAAAMSSGSDMSASIGDVKRYVEKGQYERAISKAREVLDNNPKSADAYNYIGYSERKLGDLSAAAKAYDRALAIDKNHVGVHEYYGELHLQRGDKAKAEMHLAELTRICGDCTEQQTLAKKIAEAKVGG